MEGSTDTHSSRPRLALVVGVTAAIVGAFFVGVALSSALSRSAGQEAPLSSSDQVPAREQTSETSLAASSDPQASSALPLNDRVPASSSENANSSGVKETSSVASSQDADSRAGAQSSSAATTSSAPKKEAFELSDSARSELAALIGDDAAERLAAQARTNEDAAWIATNPQAFDVFRPYIQVKLLTLAANEPDAVAFVRAVPNHPIDESEADYDAPALKSGSPAETVPDTKIPHLYQWDERWGHTFYDGDSFGMSGCGPTALAMIYQGLTGKDDRTPYDMGRLAIEGGFVTDNFAGTAIGYYEATAETLGLVYQYVDVTPESLRATLSEGQPIIAHVGPGTFSQVGHYFVLAGLADDGRVIINDPYSVERSAQLWDAELIASEAYTFYAFSLPS